MTDRRIALVTGAARGIGAAIAKRLAADGHTVETLDREPGCTHRVDLRDGELPDLSHIDICVSNAAVTTTVAPANEMTPEQWALDIGVNLTGAFRAVQACLGGMRERRHGRIVVVSSAAATVGLPGQVAYTASKAGLIGMVKTIAAENVRRGITANAVLPGIVGTENVLAMPERIQERILANAPMGRFGEPDEVAGLVAYLAAEEAGYVTGQAIGIEGGGSLNTSSLTVADRD